MILLVDTLYDRRVRLVVSAAAQPRDLYAGNTGTEVFEFDRTISRLIDMQSRDWQQQWAERQAEKASAKLEDTAKEPRTLPADVSK